MKYKILEGTTSEELAAEVNKYLKEGWKVNGPMNIGEYRWREPWSGELKMDIFYQSIVKGK